MEFEVSRGKSRKECYHLLTTIGTILLKEGYLGHSLDFFQKARNIDEAERIDMLGANDRIHLLEQILVIPQIEGKHKVEVPKGYYEDVQYEINMLRNSQQQDAAKQ